MSQSKQKYNANHHIETKATQNWFVAKHRIFTSLHVASGGWRKISRTIKQTILSKMKTPCFLPEAENISRSPLSVNGCPRFSTSIPNRKAGPFCGFLEKGRIICRAMRGAGAPEGARCRNFSTKTPFRCALRQDVVQPVLFPICRPLLPSDACVIWCLYNDVKITCTSAYACRYNIR